MDRRTFVGRAGLGAGALILGGVPVWPDSTLAKRRNKIGFAGDGVFTEGIASGEPAPNGITLWTRLGGHERDRKLTLEVARDKDFAKVIHREVVIAQKKRDHTIRKRVHGRKLLKPGEQYFYRFETSRRGSEVGRFRTALPADSREPVRVAFFSCQDFQAGFYGAHQAIAGTDDLDLVICLGDYIYERNFYAGPRTDTTGANGDGEVQTLGEYRSKYRLYRSDPDLRAMHAAHPFVHIPDDHEVEDNWAGAHPGEATLRVRVPFLERRTNAFAALSEYMPIRPIPKQRYRFYRKLALGRNADVLLLDERQYRDDQPCDDAFLTPCPEAESQPRRFLGRRQMNWLKRGLRESSAAWKLIGNQLMVMSLELARGAQITKDSWDGYGHERTELLTHIASRGIENVSFLTGDIHTFFAGDVGLDGRGPESHATEFVGGSITSLGVPETVEATTGAPLTREQTVLLTNNLRLTNPHLKYTEQLSRGYGIVEARPSELLVELKGVDPMTRTSSASSLGRMRVASGVPRVEVLERAPSAG